ncbi:hypothetical protein [Streptomyces sp. NPDC048825]|uniref:hypothetical protein n=1 Tax=Streptomyces sp. NPDC048825 TaxID=3365592 RepID=UPI003715D02A
MLITDAAVRETAANLAQSLGDDWVIDPEAPADGAAHLIYSDGRGVSFRPLFGGTAVQLWITGNAAPLPPNGATLAERAAYEAQIAARLPEGHRYNKSTTLVTEGDEDPEHLILRTLEDELLPAFEYKPRYVGHQPWIELFDNALADVAAERDAPPTSANTNEDSGPEHAESTVADQEAEHEPAPEVDENRQPEDVAGEEAPHEATTPDAEPEVTQPLSPEAEAEPESPPEPSSADEISGEADDQPAVKTSPTKKRRPRSRTTKHVPKASTP